MKTCTTCCKLADQPYRAYNPKTGEIVQGCIDDCHTPHMIGNTNTANWHNRKSAAEHRKQVKRRLKTLLAR